MPSVDVPGHPPWPCALGNKAGLASCAGTCFWSPGADRGNTQNSLHFSRMSGGPSGRSLSPGGNALLVSLVCRSVLHHFHFKGSVHSVSFSPDGR